MRIQWTPTLEERRAGIRQRDRRQIRPARNSSTIESVPSASGVSTVIDSRSITALLVSECAENRPRIRVEQSEYTIVPGTTGNDDRREKVESSQAERTRTCLMFLCQWSYLSLSGGESVRRRDFVGTFAGVQPVSLGEGSKSSDRGYCPLREGLAM